jgi:uncharacterized membrane protein
MEKAIFGLKNKNFQSNNDIMLDSAIATLLAVFSAALFAIGIFFQKWALNLGADYKRVWVVEAIADLILLVAVIPILKYSLEFPDKMAFSFALIGGFAIVIGSLISVLALSKYKSAIIAPIVASYPALVVLLGVTFLKEKLTMYEIIALSLIIAGVLILSIVSQNKL